MDDSELQQIREARMRELKGRSGGSGAAGAESGDAAAQDKNAEMLASVLAQSSDQPARERLNRVRIVKPERAAQVEQILVRMAQTGQLGQRVDEPMSKTLLDRLAQQDQSSQRIIINRKTSDDFDAFNREQKKNDQPQDDSDDDFFD